MLRRFFEKPPVLPWTLRDLRKPTSPPLNLKFFLKSTRPSLPLKKGLSKTHQSFFTIKEGSTAFPKPFFSWRRLAALGNMKANFHCAHLHNLSPQGTRDVPTALSIVFTTPSVPLVGDRNVALNHFILWLADHQRSTPAAELRFFVRGWTRLADTLIV